MALNTGELCRAIFHFYQLSARISGREKEIELIKRVLREDLDVSSNEYILEGTKVRIRRGQFAGLEGIVVKRNSGTRLQVQIDCLVKAFSFNIPASILEPVP